MLVPAMEGIKHYSTTTTMGNKTITCGFKPKVIIISRSDYTVQGTIYAEDNITGSPAQKSMYGEKDWASLGSDGWWYMIDSVTDTGFVMATGYIFSCRIDIYG